MFEFEVASVNIELLVEELQTAFPSAEVSVSYLSDGLLKITLMGVSADEGAITAVVDAHDPDALTAGQAALAASADADTRAKAIPGWAQWDEQQAIDYINETVTDLASAKTVLVAMARLLVAQRDALWPGLGVE